MRKVAVVLALLGWMAAGCSESSNEEGSSFNPWECASEGTVQLEEGAIESYYSASFDRRIAFSSLSARVQVSGGVRPECWLPSDQLSAKVICSTDITKALSEWTPAGQPDELSGYGGNEYYANISVTDFPSARYCVMGFSGDGARTWKYVTRDGKLLTGSDKAAIGQTAWIRGVDTLLSLTQYDAGQIGIYGDPVTGNRFLLKNGDIIISASSDNAHFVIDYPVVEDEEWLDHTLVMNLGAVPNLKDYKAFFIFNYGNSIDIDCMNIVYAIPAHSEYGGSTDCGGWAAGSLMGTYRDALSRADSSSSPHIIANPENGSLLIGNISVRAPKELIYDNSFYVFNFELNSSYENDISYEIGGGQTLKAQSAIVDDPEFGSGARSLLLTGNTDYPSFIELTGLTAGIGRINFRCYDWSSNADGKIKVSTAHLEEYVDLSDCRRYVKDGSGESDRSVMQFVTLDDPLTTYLRIEPIGTAANDGDSRFVLGSLSWESAY